ncbi:MAG TPA: carboxypeptidase-like regulatory domain-containing protein [Thermoanaerobaculia bacterium]|nr:carboxypeptidase-like regulatory domain-containing protein [Thermoanaerobaculia bacterium]
MPCQAAWEEMAGDERVRHCTLCSLNVYNFAEMTRDEVRELLMRTEGRVCARLYRRADGTVITRDCPTGIRAIRLRASRVAAALVAALCSLPAFAFGARACEKPRLKTHGSRVKLEIERVTTSQPAVFTGVVRDESGTPIPGVTIAVRNETGTRELTAVTDVNGGFNITPLDDGLYRVEVTLSGFRQAKMEHLQLKASEVTHASVALKVDETATITVGAIASDPMMIDGGVGVRFSQDFINKMPF